MFLVRTFRNQSKEGKTGKMQQGHGWPKLTDACGEWRLAPVDRSNTRATVAQNAEKFNSGSDGKEKSKTQCVALCSLWGCKVTDRNGDLCPSWKVAPRSMWGWLLNYRAQVQFRRDRPEESGFLSHQVYGQVHMHHLPQDGVATGCTSGRRQTGGAVWCFGQCFRRWLFFCCYHSLVSLCSVEFWCSTVALITN